MNNTARGALGAAAALGVFAWGFFMGRRGGGKPPARAHGQDGGELSEQQRAFDALMRYSARDAYGLKEADGDGR